LEQLSNKWTTAQTVPKGLSPHTSDLTCFASPGDSFIFVLPGKPEKISLLSFPKQPSPPFGNPYRVYSAHRGLLCMSENLAGKQPSPVLVRKI